jgi:hypothetical protein
VLVFGAQQGLLQSVDQIGGGRALDHGVTDVADLVGMQLNVDFAGHLDLPTGAVPRHWQEHNALLLRLGGVVMRPAKDLFDQKPASANRSAGKTPLPSTVTRWLALADKQVAADGIMQAFDAGLER